MFVFTLILLFILKFKFPKRKSIVNNNTLQRKKYNGSITVEVAFVMPERNVSEGKVILIFFNKIQNLGNSLEWHRAV